LVIDTVVCLTLAKWETVSGRFGGYLTDLGIILAKRAKLLFQGFGFLAECGSNIIAELKKGLDG
jgi:hypothetical protein